MTEDSAYFYNIQIYIYYQNYFDKSLEIPFTY